MASLPTSKLFVVAAKIRAGDTFLLCQRPEHKKRGGMWEFPGGKVEPGETPEQALVREIREELGCLVAVDGFLKSVEYAYPDVTVNLSLFSCHVVGGSPKRLEHQEIRWVTTQEAGNYDLCPADRILLES